LGPTFAGSNVKEDEDELTRDMALVSSV